MTDINTVFLIGRLTKDMELRYTNTGTAIGSFSIACNEDVKRGESWEQKAHFFECNVWGKQAETLNPYMLKGKQIAILGRLKQETWTDKSTGGNRSKVVIYAETIQLLQNIDGKGQNKPATQSSRLSGEIVPPEQFDDSMDIPF